MKILIFGSTSRVGRAINHKFNNLNIINFSRKLKDQSKIKNLIIYKTLEEPRVVSEIKKAKFILNLSGESTDIKKMFEANILFVKKLVKIINKYNKNCTFVHFSTCGIYQDLSKAVKIINEYTSPNTIRKYSKTKYIGEQYVLRSCKSKKLVVRPAQILGKGMSNQSLYRLKYYLKKNLFFYINNPNTLWAFTNIKDVFLLMDLVFKNKLIKEKSLNLVSTITFYDLIKIIKKKFKIRSFQPTINLKLLKFILKPLNLIKFKHPLDNKVIKSLTWDKSYSNKNASKYVKLSDFRDVKF